MRTKDEIEGAMLRRIGLVPDSLNVPDYVRACVLAMVDVAAEVLANVAAGVSRKQD